MPTTPQDRTIHHPDQQTVADVSAARNNQHPNEQEEPGQQSDDSFPPFTDPAFSSKPATPPVYPDAPEIDAPPKDTQYAGHPEFSQDAAENEPPDGIGNSEPVDDINEKTRHSEGVNPPDAQDGR